MRGTSAILVFTAFFFLPCTHDNYREPGQGTTPVFIPGGVRFQIEFGRDASTLIAMEPARADSHAALSGWKPGAPSNTLRFAKFNGPRGRVLS